MKIACTSVTFLAILAVTYVLAFYGKYVFMAIFLVFFTCCIFAVAIAFWVCSSEICDVVNKKLARHRSLVMSKKDFQDDVH